jgi:8-oxo-dGTP diphosphatase
VSSYAANAEIDEVRWVPLDRAMELLSYERDQATLREARRARRRTHAVVVLRHGAARSRRTWHDEDRQRPLLKEGRHQAGSLVPLLAAYGVSRLVTSSSVRCLETLTPYAETTGLPLETTRRLSEEDATAKSVRRIVEDLLTDDRTNAVVCTHRPVLSEVFDALGLDNPGLRTGEMFVLHVRGGEVRATERHAVR